MQSNWNSVDKTWSGSPRSSIYDYNTSAGRIIFNTMMNWPKKVLQISDSDGVIVTCEQALTWAIRIAQFFKKRGLDHTSVIGIAAANTTYVMPLAVACLFNATPFHAISPLFEEETIKFMFEITKPKLIFCDKEQYNKIVEATKGWSPEVYTVSEPLEGKPSIQSLLEPTTTEKFYRPEPLKTGGDQTVVILCSSGTTGMPKAVCISNCVFMQDNLLVNSETIYFLQSGLDWISGLWAFMFCVVFGSTRIISNKPFSPENIVNLVQKYKINYITLAPVQLAVLATSPAAKPYALSSLRNVNYGGSILSDATLKRIKELCKNAIITSAYAMTEVGVITLNVGVQNASATGKPMAGMTIRIVDEDGRNLAHNEVGEILVHTGMHWNGYYGNPVATSHILDFKGWIHTGDLGYFNDDNLLNVIDRKKAMLKFQGIHYWPTEIENVIRELPQVRDVCVVGIPDDVLGDVAAALVMKVPGSNLSEQDISNHVAKRFVPTHKHLHAGVRFVDKLPVNNNGKIIRIAARDLYKSLSGTETKGN
ncbi:PREDICTED: 4-coumarate--CoA ligase 1-like [Drosophila arizonae]|uniref:4-coumarate--CoA ligase 1-like n=1 Tax=Drosophila arizonae TaxID=7263 RepID=A0ABM1NPI9_DROAR|nr:PREDICTED: 4-coumarate--CoA ligase 1-like [Drosophila arizonae]